MDNRTAGTGRVVEPASRLLLSYDDAALRLGVSNRTVRELVYRGVIPSVRIGYRRLIALADLELFVAALRSEAGSGAQM